MKATDLTIVLNELKQNISSTKLLADKKKEKYLKEISDIKNEYENIDIPQDLNEVYTSLVKKGKELKNHFKINANSKELNGKIEYYIRYLKAAKGDFKGNMKDINKYLRNYIFTSILFLALSPQYFGFILPAVFFAPIFLGLKGVKNRSKQGFSLSLSVIPVALMTSFIWLRYGIYALGNYEKAISEVINATGRSIFTAQLLVTVPPILALVLFAFTLMQGYIGYKSKDLFV